MIDLNHPATGTNAGASGPNHPFLSEPPPRHDPTRFEAALDAALCLRAMRMAIPPRPAASHPRVIDGERLD
jgi:hypothetical protein